ncbi:hypothetical protein L1887_59818 [Cichorium endivia]|nr:hypothetical protein L1887_59818 [Cichorium endivia]
MARVETGEKPRIFLALELEIFADSHDRGEAEDLFIETLAEVGAEHNGKHTLVDDAQEALVLFGRDGDGRVGVLEHLFVGFLDDGARQHRHSAVRGLAVDHAVLVQDGSIRGDRLDSGELCELPQGRASLASRTCLLYFFFEVVRLLLLGGGSSASERACGDRLTQGRGKRSEMVRGGRAKSKTVSATIQASAVSVRTQLQPVKLATQAHATTDARYSCSKTNKLL